VIGLCCVIGWVSLFHIIGEVSLFLPVCYPAPATINVDMLEGDWLLWADLHFSEEGFGESYLCGSNRALTSRGAGINPCFDHLSVGINLLFSREGRFGPWIWSEFARETFHLKLDQRKS
jgi:hypothetical protein